MENKQANLLKESVDFIKKNIEAKTSEIPEYLLKYWVVPATAEYGKASAMHCNYVFWYALQTYYKHLWEDFDTLRLISLFEQFQLIIRVALGEEKDVRINSVNLFDFDNYSKLNITIS
jgi:hypothetical protein